MDTSKIILRQEEPKDYRAVEDMTRETFWNHFVPGCGEHYLAHILRDAECFIPELDIVAELDGELIGNIMYTKAKIADDNGGEHEVIIFGPLTVRPAYQRQGVGRLLLEHTKALARGMGYKAVFLYGNPGYYSRVGFVPAERYGIGTPDDMYADALQCCVLQEGALEGITGRLFDDPVYEAVENEEALSAFDQTFPPKEKKSGLPMQERFKEILTWRKPRK